ncbi:phage head-tail connector protein [Macrococcus equipercicus]|uniref:Phage head-tail connector protein n=1 Tax=Macrococcus equipercicus TaxID=69967 RepID=A0A9Q9BVE5_9STAP|nr:phage head-tail connector protein [Macrococcus equipercicus]
MELTQTLSNVKLQLGITDTKQDDLLTLIINNVGKAMLGYLPALTSVPDELGYIVEDVAVARYYRRGSEGMKSKSIEGYSVAYDKDFDSYLHIFERYQPEESNDTPGVVAFY